MRCAAFAKSTDFLQVDGRVEFAHPVDAHYSCSSLLGWPQLLVTVWQTDDLERHEIGERQRAFFFVAGFFQEQL